MFTVEIDFQTEEEHVHLIKGKFAHVLEAASFAIDFVRPYVERCKVADGEWRVFNTASPEIIERYARIQSIFGMRTDESATRV